jgi:transcriptional regulator GlxA family with amidase domain
LGLDPLRIAVLLFPAFTALDVFGPLNALNYLGLTEPMTLSLLSTDLKPVSVDRTIIDGEYLGMPSASPFFTEYVLPTHTLDDAPEFDVILVPGGGGTRNLNRTQPHVDFLTKHVLEPNLDYVLSVCTGASLLARTGQFAGKNATTNKMAFRWVQTVEHADEMNWIAKARWVVDGNLWTSSGVSAGTDMTLGWIEHVWGFNTSESVRVAMEWNSLNQTEDPFADYYGLE